MPCPFTAVVTVAIRVTAGTATSDVSSQSFWGLLRVEM
jgi:hypothetical protein